MHVVQTVLDRFGGSDRYRADDCNAEDGDADFLALAKPDEGFRTTAGSEYVDRMDVSTNFIRRMHKRAALRRQCMCMYLGPLTGYAPSAHRVTRGEPISAPTRG